MNTQGWDLATLASWRGRDVVAEDGAKLGSLEALVYDYKTGEPLWLGIGGGLFHPHLLLAPAASSTAEGDTLRVALPKDRIVDEPPIEVGEGWNHDEGARMLYEYFGLDWPHAESDDVRVLHRHTELPGRERVVGGGAGSPEN
jgi:hypothetical protein